MTNLDKYSYPNCPACNKKGEIVEQYIRKCNNEDCNENLFVRNGPYKYVIKCLHNKHCQKDVQENPRICVEHCDGIWNAFTFNQAEEIRMLHEAQNPAHVDVCTAELT